MKTTTAYKFSARIKRVEQRFEKRHISGVKEDAKFDDVSTGWWVVFEGWSTLMFFGLDEPELKAGDTMLMTITKQESA